MLAVFGFAIFSAFAFKSAEPERRMSVFQGYLQASPGNCENKNIECQDEDNGKPCVFGVTQLRRINASGTDCPSLLWQIED